jgi:hypothetical protein
VKACDNHAIVVYIFVYLTSFVGRSDYMTSSCVMVNGDNVRGNCCDMIEGTVRRAAAILALCNII